MTYNESVIFGLYLSQPDFTSNLALIFQSSSRGKQRNVSLELSQCALIQNDPILRNLDLGAEFDRADLDLVESVNLANLVRSLRLLSFAWLGLLACYRCRR